METNKQLGATITLELKLEDNGLAITGESPTVALRRVSDNQYLDWDDDTFKAAAWGTKNQVLTEVVGDAQLAGVYRHTWDSSSTITEQGVYSENYSWVDGADTYLDQELVRFVNSDLAEAILANNLEIDEGTSKLKIYEADGISVKKEYDLTDKDAGSIALQGTGPVNRSA